MFRFIVIFLIFTEVSNSSEVINRDKASCNDHQNAVHINATLSESVVFNCDLKFPGDNFEPYVLNWEKKVCDMDQGIPIYVWYRNYPTHSGKGYEGRVSGVSLDSPYGAASLNLTDIRKSDQGWYECKIIFLSRSRNSNKNETWFYLDVHVPLQFNVTPEDVTYPNLGDAVTLNCQAEGTPIPEIFWYKDANPLKSSATIGIFNEGTELHISNIQNEDTGNYTCIARSEEGQISHTARIVIAGSSVIIGPPINQTVLERGQVLFSCKAKAVPGNVTVKWFREGVPIDDINSLITRTRVLENSSLVINLVGANDSGQYLCEVSNGLGQPRYRSAFNLNVEYPAKVAFTSPVQYLPFQLEGVIQCYIEANPPIEFVTWTKDKRLLELNYTKDIVLLNNGSLLFTKVNQNDQGRYTCTPYNAEGTQGSSDPIEVLVRSPPSFTLEPQAIYQHQVGETVKMYCDAQETDGTHKPTIRWERKDGRPLEKSRVLISDGNITIERLKGSDVGFYECIASNEVATIVTVSELRVEGMQLQGSYNLTANASESAITLSWLPGKEAYSEQNYTILCREAGVPKWSTILVTPSGNTQTTINNLAPGTLYEFQVVGINALEEDTMSCVVTVRTLAVGLPHNSQVNPAPASSTSEDLSPKPSPPRNLAVKEMSNGYQITWQPPLEGYDLVQYYTIMYKTDGSYRNLNKGQIAPEETAYLVKNLVRGRTYYFKVLAYTSKTFQSSDEILYVVPGGVAWNT